MADFNDEHCLRSVVNPVNHSVVTLTYPVLLLPRELLTAVWPWLVGKSLDLCDNFAAILGGKSLQLFSG